MSIVIAGEAAPRKDIAGGGTGTVTCPDGTQVNNAQISFRLQKDKGQASGAFNVFTDVSTKIGDLTAVQINQNKYTITGIERYDSVCGIGTADTSVTITGSCGQGASIQFRAANGEIGTFTGSVACSV